MVVSMVSADSMAADSTAAGADFSEAGTRTIRTLEEYMSRELSNVAIAMWAGLLLTLLVLTIVPVSHTIAAAGRNSPRTFSTPAEAGEALAQAAKSGDKAALLSIFGPNGQEVLFTGDSVIDHNALNDFAAAYDRMHRWGNIKAGGKVLYVGPENFPFPIPLEQNAAGQWYFDTASGQDEILARHIGRNELVATATLGALANAEQQYSSQTHAGAAVKQYARKFVSGPGTQDGLYWEAAPGQPASPLGQIGDFANVAGYTKPGEKPQPFSGYHFRILTKQGNTAKGGAEDYIVNGNMTGGFAILAYPDDYRHTGIMSFIVGDDGVVYQKDLGEQTAQAAAAITEYNPGDGWKPVTTD